MACRYEIKKTDHGQYFFNLKAGNGEVILTGETYATKQSALESIASVRANAPLDGRYERKIASNSQPYFTLKAANGQTLAKSEMYPGFGAMENGIASVECHAKYAPIADLTES